MKKLAAFVTVALLLLSQQPHVHAQLPIAGHAGIYFIDIGQGASTLIVSPTGQTLLVDGGPPGAGTSAVIPLLNSLGIAMINYTVLTHYHIDHDAGLTEVINAGRVAGIAYDNGDAANLIPPSLSSSTGSAYTSYKNAIAAHPGVTRATIHPGDVIDLGGGMYATCLVAGGGLLSGGSIPINNEDLNSESISLKIEFNNFDFLVSGDLTGGGSTGSEKTPDVETFAGQLAGDVDVVQLNHHGSTTTSNQRYLSAVKAEVAVAEAGSTNTFGHPNRETVNKYLNSPATNGNVYTGTGVPAPGVGPVFYSPEQSPVGDDRVTHQEYSGASVANAGLGTILLDTDGTTSFTLASIGDGGVRINPALHLYPLDGVGSGITTDFPATVVPSLSPEVPLATDAVIVSASVRDRETPIGSVTLSYALNGVAQTPASMTLAGAVYQAAIPAQPNGTRVDYTVTGVAGGASTSYSGGYFSGITPVASLRATNAAGEPLYTGYAARIQGTVTAPSNTFAKSTNDDYVEDLTGGINVYRSTDPVTPFTATALGRTVEVRGLVAFNGGRVRLDVTQSTDKPAPIPYPYGITSLGPGAAPVPQPVTIADLNGSPEAYEGRLVSIDGCAISAGAIPPPPQAFDAFVTVTCGVDTFALKIDHDTDIQGFTPAEPFTLAGVVQQDDYLRPFNEGYNIAPRSRADLGGVAAVVPLLSIAVAKEDLNGNFVPDRAGTTVRVQGTVTSINFRPAGTEYYIQDGTAGIDLFSTTPFDALNIGDAVEAAGVVTHFNGLTELTLSGVALLSPGSAPAPQVVTLSQLADGGAGEAFEGQLIQVNNVVVTSGTFPASGLAGNVTIADATGSVVLRVNAATDIDGTATPSTPFSVVALASQFDSSAPFDSGYQILPRGLSDIVASPSIITATPTPLNFGPVSLGTPSTQTVTITNVSTASITLAPPFSITGADASQFTVGAPATTSLTPGASTTVNVTFSPVSIGVKAASLSILSINGDIAAVALSGTGQSAGGGTGTGVVISEFRFLGPAGASDEFVELYNNSDSAIDISGWKLKGSNNAGGGTTPPRATVPGTVASPTLLPARRHYLFVNTAAPVALVALKDLTYGTGFTADAGVAITKADDTIIDQVGLSAGSAFKEGVVLAALAGTANQSYERKAGGVEGSQIDSNNNSTDFVLKNPADPQNLNSAPTPTISATPGNMNFGSVAAGATASATLTITNNSSSPSPVTVTLLAPFTIGGLDASAFTISAPATTTLAAGASTTATVTFHPLSSGAKTAAATITSSHGTRTVALNGSGAPGIELSPTSFDFGAIPLGGSASTTIAITNAAASNVTLTPPFTITGPNAAEFSVDAPGATVLAAQDTTSVVVSVHSTSIGLKTAVLTISSANGGSPSVTLSASTCPTISVAGTLAGGFLGVPYSQTLTASGGGGSYVFSVASGSAPSGLGFVTGGTLSGTPTAAGSFAFTVKATDVNGCSGTAPYTVAIGTATLAGTPNPLTLGTAHVGSTVSSLLTIQNNSSFAVTLTPPFSITGTDAASFSIGALSRTSLAPGATATAAVSFSPNSGGVKNATLNLTSSSGGAATVAITGTGDAASASNGILISELRFQGAAGGNDEFIELYNSTGAAIAIGGYVLKASNNAGTISNRATIAAGTVLAPHAHFLLVNSAAPSTLTDLANQTYGTGITPDGGVAIALPDGTILDQVGLSAGSAFKEGTPLATLAAANQGYERRPGGAAGSGIDTNNNAADFLLVSPSDPQNAASIVVPALFSVSPGSVDFGSVALGSSAPVMLTITNNSTQPVTFTTPFAITGTNAGDFTVTGPAATTLAGGAFTSLDGAFTPTALGSRTATLTVGSVAGGSLSVAFAGVGTCPAIALSSGLVSGRVGTLYSDSVTASGGFAPYAFLVTAGSTPDGLLLDSNGMLAGTPTAAGTFGFTVQATDANGCSGIASYSVDVARAGVTVSWATPASIVYGMALSATQLNATASTPGSFVYSPPAGTVLNAGANQPLNVTFTPTDSANYESGSATTSITVTKADPTVSLSGGVFPYDGLAHAAAASATGVGGASLTPLTVTYNGSASVPINAGSYTVLATYGGSQNYNPASASAVLVITRAPLTVKADDKSKVAGDPNPALTASYSGFVNGQTLATSGVTGAPALTTSATAGSPAGSYPITASLGTLAAPNYSFSFAAGTMTVTPRAPDGRMFGNGFVDDGRTHYHFAFRVTQRNARDEGRFEYWVRTGRGHDDDDDDHDGDHDRDYGRDHRTVVNKFEATSVASAVFSDDPAFAPDWSRSRPTVDTVVFTGSGKWNGRSGYTFEVRAADHGEPGRNRDRFYVVIKNASGAVVSSANDTIDGGNIQSTRLLR